MANKNQKQLRVAARLQMRNANKMKRKTRAVRKLAATKTRDDFEALAKEVGLDLPVYRVLRQDASHDEIKTHAPSWKDKEEMAMA